MTVTDEAMARLFAARMKDHAARVEGHLSLLTPRERELVREAAVMGWVQGVRTAGGDEQNIPDGNEIVRYVVGQCLSFDDLYPLLGGDLRDLVRWVIRRTADAGMAASREAVASAAAELGRADAETIGNVIDGLIEDELVTETATGLRETP